MSQIKKEMIAIVGEENFFEDQEILEEYTCDNISVSSVKPTSVVTPRTTDHIQKIIELANREGTNLVPASSGPPHIRGGTAPDSEGTIVNLSKMKEIIRLDRRNKVALIQPGVTFGELQVKAEKEGLKVLMPLCPRSTKSVLGAYLEREPILIPKYHWDMTDPLLCTEVIFGTGESFRTGSAAGPGTLEEQWESGQAQKNPMGPAQSDFVRILQGAQGTMGIVTWASVKLEILPRLQKAFFVCAESYQDLTEFTYRILKPKLVDECFILNSFNLASLLKEKSEDIETLKESLPPWVLVYVIAGYEHFPEERVDYIEKDIKEIADQIGIKPVPEIDAVKENEILELLNRPIREPYWKFRARGRCQDIFFLATMDNAAEFITAMNEEIEKEGYPRENLGIYVQPIQQGRNCHIEFNLTYDPNNAEEAAKVGELMVKAPESLMDKGAFFSRPYAPWADMIYNRCDDTVSALHKVKGILDPGKIMNQGKLCFKEER